MLKVIVCGATGYTGFELIKLLLKHPEVEISAISAKIEKPERISDIFPELKGILDMHCDEMKIQDMIKTGGRIAFLALPHRVSMEFAPHFLEKGIKVIDLSADFRLKDTSAYEKYYGQGHKCKEYLATSVYGLPELYNDKIKGAKLIANPGCYPTAAILSLAPLISKKAGDIKELIIDAKTGVTGAGRKANLAFNFAEVAENMWAYKIGTHQHAPEIDQELSALAGQNIKVLFVPHLVPVKRGILTTAYVKIKKCPAVSELIKLYKDFYKSAPFVRVYDEGKFPQTKDVYYSNFCDIGITIAEGRIVIVGCIDNLIKGASGQAVQNMNIMCGFKETQGLL
ncbi:MAG: N-acetyl-gamma-glutamyl-phosphate reductase [Candidatus Omnitrophota bacterium]|nr:MAG: N-acetyl-gamma-glutamyl-phosphate reductase [Candidatus Omnitrophota bacterium]